jgi:Tol biopolymer transport system component
MHVVRIGVALVAAASALGATVLGAAARAHGPLGPSGAIAYESGNDIWLVDAAGHRRRLTAGAAIDQHPSWSPDGTRVVFERVVEQENAPAAYSLQVADLAGNVSRLKASDAGVAAPAWSPDGNRIAFERGSEVAVLDLASGAVASLTAGRGPAADPAWSPDGRRIAYARHGDLYIVGSNGGKPARLTQGRANDFGPTWSPDGRTIAFTRDRRVRGKYHFELYVVGLRSRRTHMLRSDFPAPDIEPSWSPHGSRLVFASARDLARNQLFTIAANGRDERAFVPPVYGSDPGWQPKRG